MKEPEMYKQCGETLEVTKGSEWSYVSEKSAVIGWRTSLPAKTHVEYGPKAGLYYWRTGLSDPIRNFNAHVHHLKGLTPDTAYHYRIVSMDERVRIIHGEDQTFRTNPIRNAISVDKVPQDDDNNPDIDNQRYCSVACPDI